jgi:hypothetical protein
MTVIEFINLYVIHTNYFLSPFGWSNIHLSLVGNEIPDTAREMEIQEQVEDNLDSFDDL